MAELACSNCGATDDFWAWYDAPERQSIALEGVGSDGFVQYDYSGCTDSGDAPGSDYGYYCGACCTYAESLEALVGLPEVPHVSTLAALFAEGQRIPELDHDDFHELIDLVLEEHARRVGYDVEIVATTTPEEVSR